MDLPSEDSLRWLVARYASLLAAHGEGIGTPHLVQPTGDDFPDAFEVSAYINGQSRPQKPDLEADFPDRARKPVDAAYPPFIGPFSADRLPA